VEVVVREEIAARYAGDAEGMAEALEDFADGVLGGEAEHRIGLDDPRRDDAWAAQAGG
jgi:hypothetical protein